MIYARGRSKILYYDFYFDGQRIQACTHTTKKKVAEGMEIDHRARLLKEKAEREETGKKLSCDPANLMRCVECEKYFDGAIAITFDGRSYCSDGCKTEWCKKRVVIPTMREFCERIEREKPWAKDGDVPNTSKWYRARLRIICNSSLANLRLNEITCEHIDAFAAEQRDRAQKPRVSRGKLTEGKELAVRRGLKVASVNGLLRCVRRVLRLARKWRLVTVIPEVEITVSKEHKRDRVLTATEEEKYLNVCEEPMRSLAILLVNTGLRPEEAHRLEWQRITFDSAQFQYGALHVDHGKTPAARRTIPLTPKARAVLEQRWQEAGKPEVGFVFPWDTKSGHLEHESLRDQHERACNAAGIKRFVPYEMRHTFLTRLGESGCDVWTLARIAGHSSIKMSERYVHPEHEASARAMARLSEPKALHQ